MHPLIRDLPQWRLIPAAHRVTILDPAGTVVCETSDLGAIFNALGPPTPVTERIAAEALSWLGSPIPHQDADPPWAYICSPFSAPTAARQAQHVTWARAMARLAWQHGFWPVAPHLYAPQFLDDADPAERTQGLAWGFAQLALCPIVYVLDVEPSAGMRAELQRLTPRQIITLVPPSSVFAE